MRVDLAPFLRAGSARTEVHLVFAVPAAAAATLGPGARLMREAEARVELRGDARRVDVRVAGRLPLALPCDRCLDAVRTEVDVAYREEWVLGPGAAPPPDDALVVRRAVAEPVVELDDGFWQNAAFALPSKVLCDPGCRGLCPRCGANRNREACACPGEDPDPRLAVLAQWRAGGGRTVRPPR